MSDTPDDLSKGRAISNPIVWLRLVVALLAALCAKPVLIATLGTLELVPHQNATQFNSTSSSYTTHYTGNTITTESYEFVLADGKHVKASASELSSWPTMSGDPVKLGMLFGSVVSVNGTFIAPMGLLRIVLFAFTCYLAVLAALVTVNVRRLKIPTQAIRTAAPGFVVGALCASPSLALVVIPCMLLDSFGVPGWPLGVITLGVLVFALLRKTTRKVPQS